MHSQNYRWKAPLFGYLGVLSALVSIAMLMPLIFGIFLTVTIENRDKAALPESGFIDHSGRFAFHELNCVSWDFHFSDGLRRSPLSTFSNETGGIPFRRTFVDSEDFSEGLAATATQKNKWGFIATNGEDIIKPQFEQAHSFSEGFAPVKLNGHWGFISKSGEWLVKPKFDNARPFRDGLALVALNEKVGYIDKTGKLAIEPRFQMGMSFSEGLAQVASYDTMEQPGRVQFIDHDGKTVFVVHLSMRPTSSPLGVYGPPDSFCGSYDLNELHGTQKDGEHKNSGSVDYYPSIHTQLFSHDRHQFRKGNHYGYLDKQGKVAIPFKFSSAEPFSEGLARVSLGKITEQPLSIADDNNRYGFIDPSGKFVIEPRFRSACSFHEGLAFVKEQDEHSGFIDKTGRIVIPVKSGNASDFHDGLAAVGSYLVYP